RRRSSSSQAQGAVGLGASSDASGFSRSGRTPSASDPALAARAHATLSRPSSPSNGSSIPRRSPADGRHVDVSDPSGSNDSLAGGGGRVLAKASEKFRVGVDLSRRLPSVHEL